MTARLRGRGGIAVAAGVTLVLFVAFAILLLSSNRSRERALPDQPNAAMLHVAKADAAQPVPAERNRPAAGKPSDDKLRRLSLGTWEDDYQGHRTLTLREDGTGTMIVELSGWKAAFFARRLRFEMQWSIADGQFHEHCLGGEPATQVSMVLKSAGDRLTQSILELTENRMLLLDKDGETRYDWRRVR